MEVDRMTLMSIIFKWTNQIFCASLPSDIMIRRRCADWWKVVHTGRPSYFSASHYSSVCVYILR